MFKFQTRIRISRSDFTSIARIFVIPIQRADLRRYFVEDGGSSMDQIGRKRWAIAEGYIPGESHGPAPDMTSHEACCILNPSNRAAHVEITIFFEDRDPTGPFRFEVAARRTKHLRFNNFDDPQKIPRDTPYSSLIESDVPIVVQHTRLDSRQAENALLSTIAFPGD